MKNSQHAFFTHLPYDTVADIILQKFHRKLKSKDFYLMSKHPFLPIPPPFEATINGNMFKLCKTSISIFYRTEITSTFKGTISHFEDGNTTGTLIEGEIQMPNVHVVHVVFYFIIFIFWFMLVIGEFIEVGFNPAMMYKSIGAAIALIPVFFGHIYDIFIAKENKEDILEFIKNKLQAIPYENKNNEVPNGLNGSNIPENKNKVGGTNENYNNSNSFQHRN